MPKYFGAATDEDDQQIELDGGALYDFSKYDPESKEVFVPKEFATSGGAARSWFLSAPESPYVQKGLGDKMSVPRAANVKPVEPEPEAKWGGAPLLLPNQAEEERKVRRQGDVARRAIKNLGGVTSVRASDGDDPNAREPHPGGHAGDGAPGSRGLPDAVP